MARNILSDRPWFIAKLQQVPLPGDASNGLTAGSVADQILELAARVQDLEDAAQ